jgi:hypothetical protein
MEHPILDSISFAGPICRNTIDTHSFFILLEDQETLQTVFE